MQKEDFTDEPIRRSPRALNREEFQKFLQLHKRQPWLEKKQDEFFALIELCKDIDEQNLIVNLLYNFTYLNSSQLNQCVDSMCAQIINDWDLKPENTLIIAAEVGDGADSSKAIFYHVSSRINGLAPSKGGQWKQEKNFSDSIQSALTKIKSGEIENVVLVDEFSGSGSQMAKRLKHFNAELLKLRLDVIPTVRVCVVASMEDAVDKVESLTADYFASLRLKKGISDNFEGEDLEQAKAMMLRLESELQNVGKHSFGWDKTEALYTMESPGRTPNNVFPIFWFRHLRDGQERITLLDRL